MTTDGYTIAVDPPDLRAGVPTALRLTIRKPSGASVDLPPDGEDAIVYGMTGPNLEFFQHGHSLSNIVGSSLVIPVQFPRPGEY